MVLGVVGLLLSLTLAAVGTSPAAGAAAAPVGLTLVTTNAARTDSHPGFGLPDVTDASISADGKVIAFASATPAQLIVNDPTQITAPSSVTDTNGGYDIFLWNARGAGPPITTLISWNEAHTGTASDGGGGFTVNSHHPVLSSDGSSVVYESNGRDLVSLALPDEPPFVVDHLYLWSTLCGGICDLLDRDGISCYLDEHGVVRCIAGTSGTINTVDYDPSISVNLAAPDGAPIKVVFTSSADNLVRMPTPGGWQVFLRRVDPAGIAVTNESELVSLNASGTQSSVYTAQHGRISADGSMVTFDSVGNDLASLTGSAGGTQIWRRTLAETDPARANTLVSHTAASATTPSNGSALAPAINADGSVISYQSNATDIGAPQEAGAGGDDDVFVWRSGTNTWLFTASDGNPAGGDGPSMNRGVSDDGSAVVFESFAGNLVAGDDNAARDVFVSYAPFTGRPLLVSVAADGTSGNGTSWLCASSFVTCNGSTPPNHLISADGNTIAFFSNAPDLVEPPNNDQGGTDVFVRLPRLGKTVMASDGQTADPLPDGDARDPVLSADGSTVAFETNGSDFGITDTNNAYDIYAKDLRTLKASPTISTQASAGGPVGTSVTDVATVSGGTNPTGTVTFRLFSDAACTAQVFTSTNALSAGGTATSGSFPPASQGTYFWTAVYNGDVNNNPATSACGAANESVTIGKASPTISTQASPGGLLGAPVRDVATLAGGLSPTGTVTFRLYSDAACANQVFTSTNPVPATSGWFTPTAAGTYRWTAVYSGDANNNGATSPCNAPNESVTISPFQAPPATQTVSGDFTGPLTVGAGQSVVITSGARVFGPVRIDAGGALTVVNARISGGIVANGPAFLSICGSDVAGPSGGPALSVSNAPVAVRIGDPATGCAGNRIAGTVNLTANLAVTFGANQVMGAPGNGNVNVTNGGPGNTVIKANTISQALNCSGNTPAPTNAGQPNSAASKTGQCAGL